MNGFRGDEPGYAAPNTSVKLHIFNRGRSPSTNVRLDGPSLKCAYEYGWGGYD